MRNCLLLIATGFALAASFPAAAQTAEPAATNPLDVTVTLKSRYLETTAFNAVFSDSPSLQVDATYSITPNLYVEAYAYTGFKKPFADTSSEFGGEIGYSRDIGHGTAVTVSAGRYSDYGGRGARVGDWFAKLGVQHGRVNAYVSDLSGASNSVLLYAAYTLPVGKRFTIATSISMLTREKIVNPGLAVDYRISDRFTLGGRFVLPKDATGTRRFYGAVEVSYHF